MIQGGKNAKYLTFLLRMLKKNQPRQQASADPIADDIVLGRFGDESVALENNLKNFEFSFSLIFLSCAVDEIKNIEHDSREIVH